MKRNTAQIILFVILIVSALFFGNGYMDYANKNEKLAQELAKKASVPSLPLMVEDTEYPIVRGGNKLLPSPGFGVTFFQITERKEVFRSVSGQFSISIWKIEEEGPGHQKRRFSWVQEEYVEDSITVHGLLVYPEGDGSKITFLEKSQYEEMLSEALTFY